jgi:hypothetical protein
MSPITVLRSGPIRLAVFCATSLCLFATAAGAAPPDIARLGWLEGHWAGEREGVLNEEIWTSPAGGAMLGLHKDTRRGKMVAFEFVRIVPRGDSLCYVAQPNGAPPTAFCLKELSERRVVFENLDHDFPQRVMYWLDDGGRLHARVEGEQDGAIEAMEWTWERMPAGKADAAGAAK